MKRKNIIPLLLVIVGMIFWIVGCWINTLNYSGLFLILIRANIVYYILMFILPVCVLFFSKKSLTSKSARMLSRISLILAIVQSSFSVIVFILVMSNATGQALSYVSWLPGSELLTGIYGLIIRGGSLLHLFKAISSLCMILTSIMCFAVFKKMTTSDNIKEFSSDGGNRNMEYSINEQVSSKAQFDFSKRLEEFQKDSAKIIDEGIEAKLFAQAVEAQTLKAPATAVFANVEEMTITQDNEVYIVAGWVDSQNSYGAMIRTPFKIRVVKNNGTWKTVDKFVSTDTIVRKRMASNYFGYLIIGVVITIILYFVFKAII